MRMYQFLRSGETAFKMFKSQGGIAFKSSYLHMYELFHV